MTDLYKNSNVIELKFKDFNFEKKNKYKILNKNFQNKNGLLIFYAPWCSHCKNMVNYWEYLADNFKNIYPIGAVNLDDFDNKNNILMAYFNIKKYPTVREIKNNIILKSDLNIDKDSLTTYIWSNVYSK